MLSGRQVSGSIDAVYGQALQEAGAIDAEIASLTEKYVKLREQEAASYLSLARLRLSDLAGGGVIDQLTAAERQARALLDQRSDAMKAIDAKLAELEPELARLAAERAALCKEVDNETETLEAAEQAALNALFETEDYKTRHAKAEEAEKVAHHAEQKMRFAEQDRVEKGKPYEDDPLFMYLWDRGFGTSKYKGGFIARYLDGWVARLIGFDKARANWAMLVEIPKRLKAHAETQRARADEEAKRLDDIEQAALESREPAEGRRRLSDARARLDALDARTSEMEAKRSGILEERAELNSGADKRTTEALDVIVSALKREDLRQLRQQAMRTPIPEDDTVVDRIGDIEAMIEAVKTAVTEQKGLQAEHRKRLAELERVRQDYRRQGSRNDAWDFRDAGMLTMLLTQVLGGALSGDVLTDQMNRRRVPRQRGGFGGGFPMPRFPGGFGGGGGRMPRMPRTPGGGRGGGGFRTGGGF
jgi:hypothetical protein